MNRFIFYSTIVFVSLFTSEISYSQLNWLTNAGGDGVDESMDGIKDRSMNQFYTTGYFSQSASFDSTLIQSFGAGDAYIACQDGYGDYIWVKKGGGSSSDRGISIAQLSNSDLIVAGIFKGTFTFENQSISSVGNSEDIFLIRLTNQGSLVWLKQLGGVAPDIVYDMNVDPNDNILLSGQFQGQTQYGAFSFSSFLSNPNPVSTPTFDMMVLKLDGNGNVTWAKQGGGPYDDRAMSIATDPSANIYVTGQFSDTLQFGSFVYNNNALNAGFVTKLNPNGDEQWFYRIAAGMVIPYSLFQQGDYIYIGGDFLGTLTINTTPIGQITGSFPNRTFAIKLSNNGQFQWGKSMSSENGISCRAISVDTLDNVYVSGNFSCSLTELTNQYGSGIFNSAGFRDIFTLKYNSQGVKQWENQIGGPGDDFLHAMVADVPDRPVLCGSYEKFLNIPVSASQYVVQNYNISLLPVNSANCLSPNYRFYLSSRSQGQKDCFLSRAVTPNRALYDFYQRNICGFDTLSPYLTPSNDTLTGCFNVDLLIENQLVDDGIVAPNFEYHWSNGSTIDSTIIHSTQWVMVQFGPEDGCKTYSDSVFVIIQNLNLSQLQSINGVIREVDFLACGNVMTKECDSTAFLYFPNLDTAIRVQWTDPAGNIFIGDTMTVNQTGIYNYNASIGNGMCTSSGCVSVHNWCTISGGGNCSGSSLVDLEIQLSDSLSNLSDTIEICYRGNFGLELALPSLGDTALLLPLFVDWSFSNSNASFFSNASTFLNHLIIGEGLASGWVTVTANIIHPTLGTVMFTITRDVFIKIHLAPSGTLSIIGNSQICPGNEISLTAIGGSHYSWEGDFIVSYNADSSSVEVNDAGQVSVTSFLGDSIWGCDTTLTAYLNITGEPTPQVNSNPLNPIVCPGDSVLLYSDPGINVVWHGSTSDSIGVGNQIYVATPGYYHYTFTNSNGCAMLSETIEIKEYTTPYIDASATALSCSNSSVTLQVQTNSEHTIQWLAPLSGNQESIVVSSAGTYSCQITACGIVTTASVQISAPSEINAAITYTGPNPVCPSDTITMSAPYGYAGYEWLPNHQSSQTAIFIGGGDFQLVVSDEFGCSDTASISIQNRVGSPEPTFTTDTICEGGVAQLSAVGTGVITWFRPDGTAFSNNPTIQTDTLHFDAIYYVSNQSTTCSSVRVNVPVSVIPYALPPQILGDTMLCSGQSLNLSTVLDNGITCHWNGPNGFSSDISVLTINPFLVSAVGYYKLTLVGNQCPGPPDSVLVQTFTSPVVAIHFIGDSTGCEGDSIGLAVDGDWSYLEWLPGNDTTSLFFPSISGEYAVLATDQNGCSDTSNVLSLTIYTAPSLPTFSDTTICQGNSVVLNAHSQGQVSWFLDTVSPAIFQGPSFQTPALDSTQIYFVESMDSVGCKSPKAPITVSVATIGQSLTLPSDTLVCSGIDFALQLGATEGISFEWSLNGQLLSTLDSLVISQISPEDTGYYHLHYFNEACLDLNDTIHLGLLPSPVANIRLLGDSVLCYGSSASLQSDTVWANYLWLPNLESGPSITAENSGQFQLVVWNEYGCQDTSAPTGIQVYNLSNNLAIPNTSVCDGSYYLWNNPTVSLGWYTSSSSSVMYGPISLLVDQTDTVHYFTYVGSCFSDTLSFVIDTLPLLPAPAIFGNDSGCMYSTLNLYVPSDDYTQIIWRNGSGIIGYNTLVQASINDSVEVFTVESWVNGCPQEIAQITVYGFEMPQLTLPNETQLCEDQEFHIPLPAQYEYNVSNGFGQAMDSLYIAQVHPGDQMNYVVNARNQGCIQSFVTHLSVVEDVYGTLSLTSGFCLGDELVINVENLHPMGIPSLNSPIGINQLFPDTIPHIGAEHRGKYYLTVSNQGLCPQLVDSVEVAVHDYPQFLITGDTTFCKSFSTMLSVQDTFSSYIWSTGSIEYKTEAWDSGWVKITASYFGCTSEDSIHLEIFDCNNQNQNVFTPNGNGVNDFFDPIPDGATGFVVDIFDRWGRKVYSFQSHDKAFNGRNYIGQNLSEGTYFYAYWMLDVSNNKKLSKGYLTLVR